MQINDKFICTKKGEFMKKIIYIVGTLTVILGGCILAFWISQNEKNSISPVERYQESAENEVDIENHEGKSNTDVENQGEVSQGQTIMTHGPLKFEFLSYEIIDDSEIRQQTQYLSDHYYSQELPDSNELVEYQDRDAIMAQCPELKALWENPEKYSLEETSEIYNSHLDVIEENTSMVHLDKHYVFVKCRITNTLDKNVSQHISELECVMTSRDKESFSIYTDTMCYFDRATHREGDDRLHNFFLYEFEPNETLECTLGFEVRDEVEDPEYYIGFVDVELQDEGLNPVLGKYMLNLENIEGSVE